MAIALSLRLTLKGFQVSKNSSNLKNTRVSALRFHGWVFLGTVKTNTHKKRLRCSSDFTILRLLAKWLKIALLIH